MQNGLPHHFLALIHPKSERGKEYPLIQSIYVLLDHFP